MYGCIYGKMIKKLNNQYNKVICSFYQLEYVHNNKEIINIYYADK